MKKISKEDMGSIIEILSEAESFRPLVRSVLDVVKSFGPEIEEVPKKISKWLVQNRIESVKQYELAGFSRDDAITMTLDDVWAIKQAGKSIGKNRNK